MQALLKETDKLQGRDTWDLTSVREWSEVAKEAKQSGKQAHVGRIFPIVVQRNSELPDGHPENVYKGRIVYGWGAKSRMRTMQLLYSRNYHRAQQE